MSTSTFCCTSCKLSDPAETRSLARSRALSPADPLLRTGAQLRRLSCTAAASWEGTVVFFLRGKVEILSRNFTLTEFCSGSSLLSSIWKHMGFA